MYQSFLFVRDARAGHLTVTELGPDRKWAIQVYGQAEKFYADQPWIEVILLGSDSLETLRVTHANWFPDWDPAVTVGGKQFVALSAK